MTEQELLLHAKTYIEKLANGINPLDGSAIPDGEVVNNVRISRCLFYVAGVLQQMLNAGGAVSSKKPGKAAFSLPAENRERFAFSETPITITEIVKRINALIDGDTMTSLSYAVIRDWLLSLELLEEAADHNGKAVKYPTRQGEQVGILLESRAGSAGTYDVVVYSVEAQRFIIDHLDAVIQYSGIKKENQGQPWTIEQDQLLMELYNRKLSTKEIASRLKRSSGSIQARLKKLGEVTSN